MATTIEAKPVRLRGEREATCMPMHIILPKAGRKVHVSLEIPISRDVAKSYMGAQDEALRLGVSPVSIPSVEYWSSTAYEDEYHDGEVDSPGGWVELYADDELPFGVPFRLTYYCGK